MKNLNYVEIGRRIKTKRKEQKLTQEKLSEIIDVSPSYISEIERGTSISSLSTISKIAGILHISLDYLVFGINKDNASNTFYEILKTIPEKNHPLYIDLCENIAKKKYHPFQNDIYISVHKSSNRFVTGWGTVIRTQECRSQSPMPYRLATPQYL